MFRVLATAGMRSCASGRMGEVVSVTEAPFAHIIQTIREGRNTVPSRDERIRAIAGDLQAAHRDGFFHSCVDMSARAYFIAAGKVSPHSEEEIARAFTTGKVDALIKSFRFGIHQARNERLSSFFKQRDLRGACDFLRICSPSYVGWCERLLKGEIKLQDLPKSSHMYVAWLATWWPLDEQDSVRFFIQLDAGRLHNYPNGITGMTDIHKDWDWDWGCFDYFLDR